MENKTFSKYAIELTPEQILYMEHERIFLNVYTNYEMYVDYIQRIANDLFKKRGFLTLADVLSLLSIDVTRKRELICGWIYAPEDKNHNGDNFVDIEYTVLDNGNVILDFNVDGNILDYFKD